MVPIGIPAAPQGNPPKGQRDRRNSNAAQPPTATVHHNKGDQSRTPYISKA